MREAADTFSGLRALDTYNDLRPLAENLGPALQTLITAAPTRPDAARRHALDLQRARLLEQTLDDLDQDTVLILPIADGPIPPLAGRAVDLETLRPACAISLLRLPAVAIASIQLVGTPNNDEAVLAAAALIESRVNRGE
jgi:Asp-tRNA(Asn)/Glu-tRNA(Gln) amidotransferase A subunit family amidase